MGGALLRGWLNRGVPAKQIFVREPSPSAEIAALIREQGIYEAPPQGQAPDTMVLAVKPQVMDEVLREVAPLAGPQTVILSIAAGRSIAGIARHFPEGQPIVRSMPNLPAEIGRGITAAFPNNAVSESQKADCDGLLRAVGEVVWLDDESLMDAVTAVSGSGPAYVFLLAECLAAAAKAEGLPPDLASRLARATVTGAAELLHRSDLSPAQLRENVTSPKGTTAAALSALMGEPGLPEMLTKAVAAAARRSRELAS